MPTFNARPGEQYTVRRKVFKLFGAAFHIYDPQGAVIGFCKQKAFKLKEDIRIYTDEACTQELVVMQARSILDFGSTYDVRLPGGAVIGSLRRRGMGSLFLRDSWKVFDASGREIAALAEEGSVTPLIRRYFGALGMFFPQVFSLQRIGADGKPAGERASVAKFRTHMNPFIYRLSISILADDAELDDLMILATGCLIAAIEGRQSSGGGASILDMG